MNDSLRWAQFDPTTLQRAQDLIDFLKQEQKTISFAESCTGGLLSSLICSIPGASQVFYGSIVSYANEAKENILGVSKESLVKDGAVSESVVFQMAEGVRKKFGTDFSISISGIAGPGGGTPSKPVGTVWIGMSCQKSTTAQCFHFSGTRDEIQTQACRAGIERLKRLSGNFFSHYTP